MKKEEEDLNSLIYEEQIALAKSIAYKGHEGQTRKFGKEKGKPYIIHPKRVAESLGSRWKEGRLRTILVCAGWLHDIVEDTDLTFQDLLDKGVWEEIVSILRYVTKKEGEKYTEFIIRSIDDINAMRVKVADLTDNVGSCPEGSMKEKYRLSLWILQNEIRKSVNNYVV